MTLPQTLQKLLDTDTQAVSQASQAIAKGAAAAAALAALQRQLDEIHAVTDQYTAEMDDGANRLDAAHKAASGLATGTYATTIAAITAAAPKGLDNPAWSDVVSVAMSVPGVDVLNGAPMTINDSYTKLATAKSSADDALRARQATAISRGIDADTARKRLDAALAALTAFLDGVDADLASAQRSFESAKTQVNQRDFAGAWWSWYLADALVKRIVAADDSALMTALTGAVESYAQAILDLNLANGEVAAAQLTQSRTAYNLNSADGQVRAKLAKTAP